MSPFSEGRRGLDVARARSGAAAVNEPAGDLERLWLVLDTVPAALVYVDAEERYVFSNRYHETNHFRPRAQTLGRTMREVMGEEGYARVAPHVRAALEGRTVTFDTRLDRSGASPILVRATYTPDLGPDGRVRGFVALSQDITSERTLEETLRKSERRFRHAVEGMLDAFGFLTPVLGPDGTAVDFRVEYVNAVAQRYAGLPREQYEGRLITEVFPNARESGFLDMYREVWETGDAIVEEEYPYQSEQGLYAGGGVARPADHPGGRGGGHRLARRHRAGGPPARRWRRARLASGTWPTTRRSCSGSPTRAAACVYLNRQWFEYTGQPRDAALGGAGWRRCTRTTSSGSGPTSRAANEMQVPFRTEYRLRQWEGEYRWFIDSAMPRFDGAGEFVGYIGSVIDIEDRRRAEQAVRESERQFRAVVENIPGLAWSALPDGYIDYYNRRWSEYTGLRAGEDGGLGLAGGARPGGAPPGAGALDAQPRHR